MLAYKDVGDEEHTLAMDLMRLDMIRAALPAADEPLPIAAHVIAKLGGVKATAAIVSKTRHAVSKWTRSRARGGLGGTIPADAAIRLQIAMRLGIVPLVPEDFVLPADWRPGFLLARGGGHQ
jgi:hypothetical protein